MNYRNLIYKLILLDADGTLFDYDKAERFALEQALTHYSYKGDLKKIRKRYRDINNTLWEELEKGAIKKDQLRTKRFFRLFNEYGLKYNVNKFSNYYLESLGEASFLIDGSENMCKYLSQKYTLVILTNGIKEVQLSRLEKSSINQYISDIIVSEEAGVNKPNPDIFEYTLNRLNHSDKDSVIIIGDSLTSDIQGGINFGIDTCWLNLNNIDNETNIKPKYCVNSLDALTNIL
ncbi:MAG TPA: YjjG family noncanonical pyrimidine nucleotidase [Halanaerobiales bacterium]|nr:YjjG family noncanonical pyrimidine nucleotidase [Halanaerobiales bacterium]